MTKDRSALTTSALWTDLSTAKNTTPKKTTRDDCKDDLSHVGDACDV